MIELIVYYVGVIVIYSKLETHDHLEYMKNIMNESDDDDKLWETASLSSVDNVETQILEEIKTQCALQEDDIVDNYRRAILKNTNAEFNNNKNSVT